MYYRCITCDAPLGSSPKNTQYCDACYADIYAREAALDNLTDKEECDELHKHTEPTHPCRSLSGS